MKVRLLAVGKPGVLLASAIAEYELRAKRYWSFESVEVKEERARKGSPDEDIRASESNRLLERVGDNMEIVALTRTGQTWSSADLAAYLQKLALSGNAGAAFLIGGALGLSNAAIRQANHQISLSSMTLTHEMARLFLTEQLYRAGTIVRGEPYHKARA